MRFAAPLTAGLLALSVPAAAQQGHAGHDSAFHAMQSRGALVMGVDQYVSVHRFDSLPDGGRIEFRMAQDDSAGVATIRAHLKAIVEQFRAGNFADPAAVHAQEVPGTRVMAARRDRIRYAYREVPLGGEIRLTTRDRQALAAVHEFLAFQRADHRTGP